MDNNTDDLVFTLRRLILSTETKARSIEKMFSRLKIENSEEREKVITEIKKKKDKFLGELKRTQRKNIQEIVKSNKEKEDFIGSLIEQARMKENEQCAEIIDIAIARNKLYVSFI
jgi:hypothetical protein